MSYESRRRNRRAYLTKFQAVRRASLKARGSKRIEITLTGQELDNYFIIRHCFGGNNQRVFKKALAITASLLEIDRKKA